MRLNRLPLTLAALAALTLSLAPVAGAADAPEAPLAALIERPGPDALVMYLDRAALPRDAGAAILRAWDADGRHSLTPEAAVRFATLAGFPGLDAHASAKSLLVLTPRGRTERLPGWIAELRESAAAERKAADEADRRAEVRGSTRHHLDSRMMPALQEAASRRDRAAALEAKAAVLELDLADARAASGASEQ